MLSDRQLVAIMFTDIQGYTSLMQQDEEIAIKCRDRHREVFNSITKKFDGTILQYFGDGTLSTFKSAIDAVQCAMEMQMEFQKDPCIPVRIGIHLGDIVRREDEIIGDGVNVASRIESLAVAGSVFISDKVYDEIKNQSSIQTQSLKTFELKNVDKPIEVFAISNKGLIIPNRDDISGKTKAGSEASSPTDNKRSDKPRIGISVIKNFAIAVLLLLAAFFIYDYLWGPGTESSEQDKSIAVLPFTNMTNDPEQEYFSDGITEEILTHLSRIADIRVVSRTSVMQYKNTTKTIPEIGRELGVTTILEGSVRKNGDQVRITAQLIDARSDEHIWADTYDRDISKIFDIQTEVAKEILRVLEAKLTPREEEGLDKSVTSEITAYDYYLRGSEALKKGETLKNYKLAAGFFREAINEDPYFAAAYVGLAWSLTFTGAYGVSEEIWKDSAIALNQTALSLDPELDEAWFFLGTYSQWDGDMENAIELFEKTLELNPNHSLAKIQLGELLLLNEKYDEGIELIIEGWLSQLSRKDPSFYLKIGTIYTEIFEFDKAKKYFLEALSLRPDYYGAYYSLVEVCFQEGNFQQAVDYAERMIEIEKNVRSLDRLAWAYMLNGNNKEAAKTWQEMGELQAEFDGPYFTIEYKHRLAYVKWQMGEREEAEKLFNEQIKLSKEVLENNTGRHITGQAYDLAGIYSFLGDEKMAIKYLRLADEVKFILVTLIERDPLYNNIRHLNEFEEIVGKYRIHPDNLGPKFEKAKEKIREMEEKGILRL